MTIAKRVAGITGPAMALVLAMVASAEDLPVTGQKVAGFEPVDEAMTQFMSTIGCQAGAVAIGKGGRVVFSRGYGWSDQGKKTPTAPGTMFRIASVSKPVTAAIVRQLIAEGKLSLDTKAFPLLQLEPPPGGKVDPRLETITVAQLLEHKGGWDREHSYDPMFRVKEVKQTLHLTGPARPVDVVRYMIGQPLQFDPGERSVYSNFGYCVLGRVIEKATGLTYAEAVQKRICAPIGVTDLKLGRNNSKERDPHEVWYPVADNAFSLDVMDAHGGLIASAPGLCQFLAHYWINGEPRQAGQRQQWTFFGSLPGTTSMGRQRPDGVEVAALFNGRRDSSFSEDNTKIQKMLDAAIDNLPK